MIKIYDIITEIRNTSSTNIKKEIIAKHKDNTLFKHVLHSALDPKTTYGIKKIPEYDVYDPKMTLQYALVLIEKLADRDVTGNEAIQFLKNVLELLDENDAKVLELVIKQDLKMGADVSLINEALGFDLIYDPKYMGAISYNKKKAQKLFDEHTYAYSDVKYDGRYVNIFCSDRVWFESRAGLYNIFSSNIMNEAVLIQKYFGTDVVLNGEALVEGVDRYTGNGIISSYLSITKKQSHNINVEKDIKKFTKKYGKSFDEIQDLIYFVVWDYIPLDKFYEGFWDTPRNERLEALLCALQSDEFKHFKMAETKIVSSLQEAIEHYREMIESNEEGTILKSAYGPWEDGKHDHQIKIKKFDNFDLKITGFQYGTPGTKNENVISTLKTKSQDGILVSNVSGIKEPDMIYITKNMDVLLGAIVEVKACGVSQDREGNASLLHPSFVKIRDDKNTANTYHECVEISNNF